MEKEKITSTSRTNNMVNYSIEEADAALDVMIATTLSEFDAACQKIDAEYENQSVVPTQNAAEE